MSCLGHAAQLERARNKIESLGARVVAVGPGSDAAADRVRKILSIKYQVFGDRRASVYGAFGFRKVLAIVQQSGAAVIGSNGVVTYIHRTANPQDALRMGEILAAVEPASRPR